MQQKPVGIYLDYNATTPLDPRVFEAMQPYFLEHFGNPASAGHQWGWTAENAVIKARQQVANLIGARPAEVTFTGSATEANNWVIFGLLSKLREENPNEPIHFITSAVEHSSIIKAMAAVKKLGVEVDVLPVNSEGVVEIETVRQAIKPHTKLMSFMWINNESGAINPLLDIAKLAKEKQIYLHTDATQAAGKIPMNVTDMGIDLLSFSAHKIYGPKGIGVLFIRGKDPKVQLNPLIYGGGQERGLRSGTLNVPGIVGFGAAAEICQNSLAQESLRLTELRKFFWKQLQEAIPGIRLNGSEENRAPNNLNITLPGFKTETLLPHLQKLGVSTGSACGTGAMVISHVLTGMGLSPAEIQCSLRISLGRWTTQEELLQAVEILKNATVGKK